MSLIVIYNKLLLHKNIQKTEKTELPTATLNGRGASQTIETNKVQLSLRNLPIEKFAFNQSE